MAPCDTQFAQGRSEANGESLWNTQAQDLRGGGRARFLYRGLVKRPHGSGLSRRRRRRPWCQPGWRAGKARLEERQEEEGRSCGSVLFSSDDRTARSAWRVPGKRWRGGEREILRFFGPACLFDGHTRAYLSRESTRPRRTHQESLRLLRLQRI